MTTRESGLRARDTISPLLIGGALVATAVCYSSLPAQLPIHFNLHGVADGFAPRAVGAWLLPATAVALHALISSAHLLLPRAARERWLASPRAAVSIILTTLMVGLQGVVLHASTHPGSVGGPLVAVLACTWLALGLVLPRVRRNPFVGVRTPWSLASDENWAKTHWIAGHAFVLGAIVALAAVALGSPAVGVVCLVAPAVVPVIYSWRAARSGHDEAM